MKQKKSNRQNSRKAFSLVEVMISLLLAGIIISISYILIDRTFKSLDRQKQSLDTLHEARYFLAMIERDLREMTRVIKLDTVFKENIFDKENGLFYSMEIEIPDRSEKSTGFTTVIYGFDGPLGYQDQPGTSKTIYRQEKGLTKKTLITKQLNFLKVFGTDGTVFRNRSQNEALESFRNYLRPHYYHPSNPVANGLNDLAKIRGIEVQLDMIEMLDSKKKPIKNRAFITRIYPRVLNAKNED
ncbi:MAG: prepilin-type N-terminal cleavage/methylation domain-containing protein [Candidatus Riflebacteria bacterium]|nr:prepilin-type N-terminal cleavage/methylation domain-containing protein [Candidatus Riflebacteria bacterium]